MLKIKPSTRKKVWRVLAMYIAMNMLAEYIIPIKAFALTGGPSQPEVESFEPVSTTEMVNEFTGDFNYNIPLMTVPGPNGGYPINMAYHAGIGMEQEASWVGLGWNINPGVVNRNMRGLPDDFDGDLVRKTMYYRPQETWALDYSAFTITPAGSTQVVVKPNVLGSTPKVYAPEDVGFERKPSFSYQIHWNNYKGLGYGLSMNLTSTMANVLSSHFSKSLNLSYDTDGGLGVTPSISYSQARKTFTNTYSIGLGYNSRQGMTGLTLGQTQTVTKSTTGTDKETIITSRNGYDINSTAEVSTYFSLQSTKVAGGSGINFCSTSNIPNNSLSINGSNIVYGVTIAKTSNSGTHLEKEQNKRFSLSYAMTESKEIDQTFPAYGFNYYEDADNINDNDRLLDFNREKDNPANKNASSIAIGYATQDVFYISGQGVSGAFKPFRSEVPSFSDATVVNEIPGAAVQIELGRSNLEPSYELGGNFGVNYSYSYSGDWHSLRSELDDFVFVKLTNSDPLYEPAYYKSTGEMTASPYDETDYMGGEKALRFDLRNIFDANDGILAKVTDDLIENYLDNSPISLLGNNKRTTRQKRSQLLSTRTSGQIDHTAGYGHPIVSLYAPNEFPSAAATPITYDYGNNPGKHIGEVCVNNPDGYRYVYGLPAYNTSQKEVMFTKEVSEGTFAKTQAYTPGTHNGVGNPDGQDHFYMSTEIPEYAYSYLITAIYSPDYVDLTGNGPSEDDFGYWVKFNYSQRSEDAPDYGWRVPYRDANFSKNAISNTKDDKLSYMYGTKEVYYLNSIETKTHEANFILNDNGNSDAERRRDGIAALQEDFLGSTSFTPTEDHRLRYLKSIELVSKKEPSKIIKTVNFEYDYSLCKEVVNNSDEIANPTTEHDGKLTLKKVWFKYLGNEKGYLSPYEFTYEHDTPVATDNPDYSQDLMDRWGYYKPDQTVNGIQFFSNENSYVNQSDYNNNPDGYANAWNLKRIDLPSGGTIKINYESDDYAFVQDKPAMQMQQVTGTGSFLDVNSGTGEASSNGNKLNDRNTIVFFALDRTFNGSSLSAPQKRDSIFRYVDGVNQVYFKIFEKLKRKPGATGNTVNDYSFDYVEGYAEIDKSGTWYGFGTPDGSGIISSGWVKIKNEERNPWNPIGQTDHPFKLAGWQYLRMERMDLFDDGNLFQHDNDVTDVIQGFVNIANDFQRIFGYYNFCQSRGYCNEIYLSGAGTYIDPKPSYIRLNTPDKIKYGGGHRVKDIRITDGWEDKNMSGDSDPTQYEYGIEYQYTLPDGTSSGVAEYEPLIGGEENPFRVPLRYQERKYPYRNDGLYAEEPFGESLYPAPNIGYSRVITKSISHQDLYEDSTTTTNDKVTKNRSGISVTEFYTAKNFPVISLYTDLKKKGFGIPVIIPFIGEIAYNNKGYSQGFSVELNNMHGQLKSQAVYSAFADVNDPDAQPVSKSEYSYQTDEAYSDKKPNHLSNHVQVLDADGIYRVADIGKTHEFYIDRQQHSNFSVNAGIQVNAGASPPYTFWGNLFPSFEINKTMYRSVSTLKVIQRNGVLAEVRTYKDGAFAINKNLMYDAETGQPLLTQTINNFDKPVYTYNYASHWAYNTMGGAYKNVGARFDTTAASSGILNFLTAENYFVPGDELEYESSVGTITRYWVTAVNAATDDVTVVDEYGNPASEPSGTWTIVRSAYRNQQTATDGVIVSLSNPVTDRRFPLFEAFNAYNASGVTGNADSFGEFFKDCATGEMKTVAITWTAPNTLEFEYLECPLTIHFPEGHGITDLQSAFDYDLAFSNGNVIAVNGSTTLTCTLEYSGTCFQTCLDDVLHAEAYRNKDVWDFNYLDFGNPAAYGALSGEDLATGVPNDYRYGTKGIWRSETSWLYQIDRKQKFASASGTDIAKDGTYNNFVLYNWAAGDAAALNPQWSLTNTITEYSPYGYELENKNPLDVYSSALYGYDNSLATAVASNTRYRELAFDGFEDYALPATYTTGLAHGHLHFTSVNSGAPIALTAAVSHTGKSSLSVASNGPAKMDFSVDNSSSTTLFNPLAGQKYHLSVWVKTESYNDGQVLITNETASTTIATAVTNPAVAAIDGWKQINIDFTAPAGTPALRIKLSCIAASSGTAYFDDLRIQPYTSGIKTYVYDPNTLWLVAELDDRNFATFYNYDEQGGLVQVKKETENGITTIRTSRSNTAH